MATIYGAFLPCTLICTPAHINVSGRAYQCGQAATTKLFILWKYLFFCDGNEGQSISVVSRIGFVLETDADVTIG